MKIAFLINGLICNKQQITTNISSAFQKDHEIDFYTSEYAGHMVELCHTALQNGSEVIAVAGGDGTLNEVVNGIVTCCQDENGDVDWQQVAQVKMVVIPRGSGNDFSRLLYQDSSLDNISRLLEKQSFTLTDIGQANFNTHDGEKTSRYFLNITDIGIGGDVSQKRIQLRKWLPGTLNYSFSIFSTFLTFKKKAVEILADQKKWSGNVMSLVIANGKYFGNGLGIAPKAETTDGEFALVRLGNVSVVDYLKHLGTIKKCELVNHPEVEYSSAKNVTVTHAGDERIPIDMDGEYVGVVPLSLTCLQQKLQILTEG